MFKVTKKNRIAKKRKYEVNKCYTEMIFVLQFVIVPSV
jgi:hypothetical protein